ncbi:MAG: formimidoylglutamate deiminase [Alphaproteobacteria bacterium]|nr:formimidoylglutamate deiminase [Alphaproteobacteria bacterium]MBV9693913.1 formimidoylglutamate deiminase [Alphaproteobacteria bacterium]
MSSVQLWFAQALLPTGWAERVRFRFDGMGAPTIQPGVDAEPADEVHAIAVPGIGNLHSHAFQRAMAGLAETAGPGGDNFWTWRTAMYRFAGRIGPDALEAVAAQTYVEMLECGFTRAGEFHYLHRAPDGNRYDDAAEMSGRIAAAAAQTGIGLTLLPVFYAHSGFGGAAPNGEQRRFVSTLAEYETLLARCGTHLRPLGDAALGIAPHSLRAVTPEELTALARLPGPVHIHIAEQTREVDDCLAWSGARPVRWLLDHLPVDARWCLVHATHMDRNETGGLAASGAVAGLCPITEANLGDGLFALPDYLAAHGRIGIGTDSNVRIDLAEELRLLEYGQRLARRARNVAAAREGASSGATLLHAALAGGVQALGADMAADLVSLDPHHPSLLHKSGDALIDSWIFAAGSGAVDCVWRNGTRLVEGGRHKDRTRIAARFRAAIAELIA